MAIDSINIFENAPASLIMALDRIVTSHSIDGTHDSCPRRFEFMYMWQKMPERERGGFAAEVGTAIHEAVQEWARYAVIPGVDRKDPAVRDLALTRGYFALLKWWPWSLEEVQIRLKKPIGERTLGNAILLFEEIISQHWWDDWDLVVIDGFGPAIEVPWLIIHTSFGQVPRPQGGFAFLATQGKIDFLLRHRRTAELRVFDIKTTVKELKAHDAAFKFSGQGGLYSIILAHAMGWDWKQQGLTMSYIVSYFGTTDKDMTVTLKDYDYTPADIQDMVDIKLRRLHDQKTFAETGHWPRRSHGCDFYGNPCGFLDICGRREPEVVAEWFAFEQAKGRVSHYQREYEPIWSMVA